MKVQIASSTADRDERRRDGMCEVGEVAPESATNSTGTNIGAESDVRTFDGHEGADVHGALALHDRIAAGLAELLDLLSTHADQAGNPVPVAIETTRGPPRRSSALKRSGGPPHQPDGRGPIPRTARGPARNPTPKTPRHWPTSCAPTATPTAPASDLELVQAIAVH
jgi:hypothetical protein